MVRLGRFGLLRFGQTFLSRCDIIRDRKWSSKVISGHSKCDGLTFSYLAPRAINKTKRRYIGILPSDTRQTIIIELIHLVSILKVSILFEGPFKQKSLSAKQFFQNSPLGQKTAPNVIEVSRDRALSLLHFHSNGSITGLPLLLYLFSLASLLHHSIK